MAYTKYYYYNCPTCEVETGFDKEIPDNIFVSCRKCKVKLVFSFAVKLSKPATKEMQTNVYPDPLCARTKVTISNEQVLSLYMAGLTFNDIAGVFMVDKERIRQILKETGRYETSKKQKRMQYETALAAEVKHLFQVDMLNVNQISAKLKISNITVSAVLRGLGLSSEKKEDIGCGSCEINHYARGLCRHCYNRYRKQAGKTLEPVSKDTTADKILLVLGEGEMTPIQISQSVGASYQHTLRVVKELSAKGVIEMTARGKRGSVYAIAA